MTSRHQADIREQFSVLDMKDNFLFEIKQCDFMLFQKPSPKTVLRGKERETSLGCLLHAPYLGFKPATLWSTG